MADKRKSVAIGIDLGTSYSCVGVWQHDHVEIIADSLGNKMTPSTVAFTDTGMLVGDDAKKQVAMNPRNTVYDAKRLIGRRFSDNSVQSDMKWWPFKVVSGPSEKPMVVVNYHGEENQFSSEEISAMVLIKLKEIAEAFLASTVKNVVLTVPAYFTNSQRKATEEASIISGFNNVRIINEPTAAAIAYGLDKKVIGEKNVLIFDLGGGTLDVSLLTINEGIFEEKSISGDTHLGGDDFDNRMVNHFIREFKRKNHKDISKDARALRTLKASCEKAKRTLSFTTQTTIEIDSFYEGIDFYFNINRNRFEALNIDLFQKCIYNVEKCLNYAKIEKGDVHEVVLVGGSTWIPKIQQLLQEFFNGKDLCKSINPDEVVAYGAAVQAACLNYEGNQKFQDKILEKFCNRIVEEHEKLEAKSALENYLYHMRYIVKKVEDEIYEADSWLDVNQIAEVDAFEDKMKELESTVAEMYQKDVVSWSIDGNDKKNMEAKKKLGSYAHSMGDMVYRFKENLGVSDKRKIKNATDEVISWLHRNPTESANEFEYKLKELERICNPIVLKIHEGGAFPVGWSMEEDHERNLKAKNAFENYFYNMRNTMKDERIWEMFNLRDKKIIEDVIDEVVLWLDANQEANGFEAKLRELESVYNPIIVKMHQSGAFAAGWWMEVEYKKQLEAKNALEYYTYNMEITMKDERIGGKLDVTNKKIIDDTIDEAILWLDANNLSEVDAFEDKLAELESICNPIIFKMYQDGAIGAGWSIAEEYKKNMEAESTLENYIYKMENVVNEERIREKLGVTNKKKIDGAIVEAVSWLDASQLAEADEFENKLKELESVCNPIIANMYQDVDFSAGSEMEKESKKNLEAKKALDDYMYNMKNTMKDEKIGENLSVTNKKKIEDAVDETSSWLDANQLAEVDVFEYKLKVLENVCNPIIVKMVKDGDAKNALEHYTYNMKNTVKDEKIRENLSVTNKKKIEDAIDEMISWLDTNQLVEAYEFEYKLKVLENVCNPIIAKMVKDRDAKNALEHYTYNMKNTVKDEKIRENLSVTNKKKIEDAIDEMILWLDTNQLVEADEFEYKLKVLENVCNPIIAKMVKDGDAKNALEHYTYNMKNTVKDEKIRENLSVTNKKKIEDAVDEMISWLDTNQLAEADEFEYKLKVLENVCSPIIAKMVRDGDAKKELEYYTFNMKNTVKDEKINENLSVSDKKKIEDAIDETISWLDTNQLAEADEFEYKLKVLENICNPIIAKMVEDGALVAGRSLEEEYEKNMEAKNALENYTYQMEKTTKDENNGQKLGVTNMKKTGNAMMKQFRGWMRIIFHEIIN